jgi:SAM-dependent methyltransferase
MTSDWYKHFSAVWRFDFWRAAVAPNTQGEVEYVQSMLNVSPGARLLDIPCGDGRHALEFAAQGFRVSGVDLSEQNISDAQAAARKRNVQVEWRLSDKRDLPWSEEFDGAYCLGNSFGYLDDRGMDDCDGSWALKPGARFVVDTAMAAESIIPNLDESWWMKVDDIHVLIANHYMSSESVSIPNSPLSRVERLRHANSIIAFTPSPNRRALQSAGLNTSRCTRR